jgi:hypothetical protein
MKTYCVKFQQMAVITGIALTGISSVGAITPASALTFYFRPVGGTSAEAIAGFKAAGDRWSSLFTDNVTINIDINFTALDLGILAEASSTRQRYDYSQVYTALSTDRTSADDRTAVTTLPTGSTFNMLLNRTANSPYGSGSATPYLDSNSNANNRTLDISNANAKALGLILDSGAGTMMNIDRIADLSPGATINSGVVSDLRIAPAMASIGSDASIAFSTGFAFDFDPSDGIDSGKFDFIGVATHEIGHALGFTSGVDVLDGNSPPKSGPFNDDGFTFVNTLDLFRYSAESKADGAIDWTADTRDKYFSLDRGDTSIAAFATGVEFGDRLQASHWKDSSNFRITPELGIMNPTFTNGQLGIITENDLRAFDVIGWNRVSATATEVPEPADFIGTVIGAIFGVKLIQKCRQQRAKSIEVE